MESKIEVLRPLAAKSAKRLVFLGYSVPIVQFCAIFYGTFEVLSWDIMEPICYLMQFANFNLAFAFYLIHHKDLECDTVHEILTKKSLAKRARAHGIDMEELAAKKVQLAALRDEIE